MKLKVKTESLPVRCETCHQADLFDPLKNYCSRCSGINIRINCKAISANTILRRAVIVVKGFTIFGGVLGFGIGSLKFIIIILKGLIGRSFNSQIIYDFVYAIGIGIVGLIVGGILGIIFSATVGSVLIIFQTIQAIVEQLTKLIRKLTAVRLTSR